MLTRKMYLLLTACFLASVFMTAGCGGEEGSRRVVEYPKHSLADVIRSLENAGFEIGRRMTEEEGFAEMMEDDREGSGAEEVDQFEVNGRDIAVYVFDLSREDARQNMQRTIEGRTDPEVEERPLQHDNLLVFDISAHPQADAIREAILGM